MQSRSDEVLPGLWSLPVTLQAGGLGAVFAYAFEIPSGLVLIDLGFGTETSQASLEARLAEIGASFSDVRGVVFTHVHPDHYGLAGVVRESSGAWLALHPADRPFLDGRRRRPNFLVELSAEIGIDLGGRDIGMDYARNQLEVMPDRTLSDGEIIEFGRWRLKVLHTPGHSPGHCCFVLEGTNVMILGDHVLSRTTPNVSYWPWNEGDPLADYLRSLRLVGKIGRGLLGLPGHEERIVDIPARVDELVAHHTEQLDAVTQLVGGGHDTIGEIAQRMPWSREWPDLGHVDRVMAVGEAYAHLRTLERRGAIRRVHAQPARFMSV